jgi:gliding motility-associated-like protein
MDPPIQGYFQSTIGAQWISANPAGQQTGPVERLFFYRISFSLPCSNPCGNSLNNNNAFCLGLDLYADNSIYEIYVNGVAQSPNLGGLIPVVNPFSPAAPAGTQEFPVELCYNWQAGQNTLIIAVASTPPVEAFLCQQAVEFPPNVSNYIVATICQGDSFSFGNQILTQSTTAVDTVSQSASCDSIVALDLIVKPSSFTRMVDSICSGQSFLGYSSSGTYLDTFSAANGCDSIRTLSLTVMEPPDPDLGNVSSLCLGDSLVLSPGVFSSYLWQDGSVLDHFVVTKTGTYSVTVTNTCGSATKAITITAGACHINFPNAFTPTRGGKNAVFMVLTSFNLQQYDLSVYNRSGQKVFETHDQGEGWDGSFNGKAQESGTYVWACSFKNNSSVLTTMKGTVLLIR